MGLARWSGLAEVVVEARLEVEVVVECHAERGTLCRPPEVVVELQPGEVLALLVVGKCAVLGTHVVVHSSAAWSTIVPRQSPAVAVLVEVPVALLVAASAVAVVVRRYLEA